MDMTWFQTLVLGLVQGLTEFLPISSLAHLRIVSGVFRGGDDVGGVGSWAEHRQPWRSCGSLQSRV